MQEYQLSELLTFHYGKSLPERSRIEGKYPVMSSAGITGSHNEFLVEGPGVIVGRKGSIGTVYYEERSFYPIDTCFYLTVNDTEVLDLKYSYYLLSQSNLKELNSDAAVPGLNRDIAYAQKVRIPSKAEQLEIVAVLDGYEDLIKNNTRRIAILETIAQNLYREWFVNFRFPGYQQREWQGIPQGKVPQDWDTVELGKLITVRRGKTITRKTAIPEDVPVVAGGLQPAYFHSVANTTSPVITVSASGANAGYVNMYTIPVWASDCSYIDTETTPYVYYYYLLMKDRQVEITRMQTGAAQPHVYPKDLMRLEVFDVPTGLLDDFTERVTPVFRLMAKETLNKTATFSVSA